MERGREKESGEGKREWGGGEGVHRPMKYNPLKQMQQQTQRDNYSNSVESFTY
jgi:hypothetical protein